MKKGRIASAFFKLPILREDYLPRSLAFSTEVTYVIQGSRKLSIYKKVRKKADFHLPFFLLARDLRHYLNLLGSLEHLRYTRILKSVNF